ncbi:MAG: helix-turn-helix transcriptional regulator [Oscillospiraceae bacterium]|nr:helix-turn-helix transcriptional regulator [Oscillospiraceae bacterium]
MRLEHNLQSPGFTVQKIDVLQVSREAGYTHSYRNGRTKHGFILVLSGVMQFTLLQEDVAPLQAEKGTLVFIPQGTSYTGTYLEADTQIRVVQFDLSSGTLPSYLQQCAVLPLPNAAELIGAFFLPAGNHPFGNSFYSLFCFYNLLWQLDEQCTRIPSKYKKLLPALSALSAASTESHPITYYAALCNMSESTFRRLFREYTGQSPVEYRNALRLNAARVRLQSGEYNVSEAAESAGFTNLSFFIRLYKKKYGYTPKKE